MSVDLKCRSLLSRRSVLLQPQRVVILEHSLFSDRVRRIGLDRIEQVAWSRTWPWPSLLVTGLLVVLPAAVLILAGANQSPGMTRNYTLGVGLVILVLGGANLVWQVVCCQSRIFITRAGETQELRTITSARRVDRFLADLFAAIRAVQQGEAAVNEPAQRSE
jgi:hypothetical protein